MKTKHNNLKNQIEKHEKPDNSRVTDRERKVLIGRIIHLVDERNVLRKRKWTTLNNSDKGGFYGGVRKFTPNTLFAEIGYKKPGYVTTFVSGIKNKLPSYKNKGKQYWKLFKRLGL